MTSALTHDANGDGRNDTYTRGDRIVFDVEFTEPVKVSDTGTVRMRLRVGQDGDTLNKTLKTADLTNTFHGGKTLRFTCTSHTRGDQEGQPLALRTRPAR